MPLSFLCDKGLFGRLDGVGPELGQDGTRAAVGLMSEVSPRPTVAASHFAVTA